MREASTTLSSQRQLPPSPAAPSSSPRPDLFSCHAFLPVLAFACSLGWVCFGPVDVADVPSTRKRCDRWQRRHRASWHGGKYVHIGDASPAHPLAQGYPENINVVAIVVGLAPCYGGECYPASSFMGNILYQGPYTPQTSDYYANYTVTVPEDFPTGDASLNVINLFMVGVSGFS